MKTAYRANEGHIVSSVVTKTRLSGLTFEDAEMFMFGNVRYDRRKSFKKSKNRHWADGVHWS